MHLAAREGFIDVVKVLRKYGADVEIQTSAMVKNVNSLMLACQKGHYSMVEHLHTVEGALLDKKDKLKRTALMHASINGHAHIVSYLLRAGVNMNLADSSGNFFMKAFFKTNFLESSTCLKIIFRSEIILISNSMVVVSIFRNSKYS